MKFKPSYSILIITLLANWSNCQEIVFFKDHVRCEINHIHKDFKVFEVDNVSPYEILGTYDKYDSIVRFTPFNVLEPYRNYSASCGAFTSSWMPTDLILNQPYVKRIFPKGPLVPQNLLKINIQFSEPMFSFAYEHIWLEDQNGNIIERAFIKDIPELWNDDHSMLTLWFEPGRIKRELGPNLRLGPVLDENRTYRLVLSSKLKSRDGVNLSSQYIKEFVSTVDDRISPNVDSFQILPLNGIDYYHIVLKFNEEMDVASLQNNIWFDKLDGTWSMFDNNSWIAFVPTEKIPPGKYKVMISSKIEDLAGNNLNRLFDQEMGKKSQKTKDVYELEVEIPEH